MLFQEASEMVSDNIFDSLPVLSATKKAKLVDELTRYLAEPTEVALDPLLWWNERRAVYPHLSRMALNYLCIPGTSTQSNFILKVKLIFILATSVDVERVFSKGRLVLSHVRNRLSVESTRALLCLGNWSKLGLVNKDDIRDATALPELKEGDCEPEEDFDMVL
jgi:hypothetical protein